MKLVKRLTSVIQRRPSKPIAHAADPSLTPRHSPRLEVDTESLTAVTARSTNFR